MTRDQAAAVIIARVIVREGRIGDAGDGHGITRFGQTDGWLSQFGLPAPKTVAEAGANYQTWLVRTGLIGVCALADDLADITIDWGVNSGHRTAIRGLQLALPVVGDGVWGPETQAAVDQCIRGMVARSVLAARVRFMGSLITDNPTKHADKAHGWMVRVAGQIEALT